MTTFNVWHGTAGWIARDADHPVSPDNGDWVGRFVAASEQGAIDMAQQRAISTAAATLGRIGGSKTSERKAEAVRENGKQGGRPQSDYATKFHRNGEVTVWDVYQQRWTRLHVSRVSDQVLSSLDHDERLRILNHRERNQTADE